jgi:hypothetical protein
MKKWPEERMLQCRFVATASFLLAALTGDRDVSHGGLNKFFAAYLDRLMQPALGNV